MVMPLITIGQRFSPSGLDTHDIGRDTPLEEARCDG